jgi:hypothetical protein
MCTLLLYDKIYATCFDSAHLSLLSLKLWPIMKKISFKINIYIYCVNVKFALEQAMKAQRWSRCIALLFLNLGDRWRWVVNATPRPFYPRAIQYPLCRGLGELQGRSGRVRKISPTPAFDPRTVEPVVSRYTDWAVPGHINIV